jgi:hypothetical protein
MIESFQDIARVTRGQRTDCATRWKTLSFHSLTGPNKQPTKGQLFCVLNI